MKCISVYTNNFEQFSDIFETIVDAEFAENEEKEVEGITVSHSGEVPEHYFERMSQKPEVVVMRDKSRGVTILQHGSVFEILIPDLEGAVL
ncbi:NAD/NADP transhydrogenase alpha subunit [Paenibacillus crassostreae]|uniref:NAD/NADP transhydrogenase alpha subunit n=1 Tax=Paenibacillus crassostreae TaxID=1763538 RepID=A0A167DMQ1_9BACL|nr:NAD/NADP transhydrogenase alpha subunit [Paenibacillus crassostreae]AOZ91273.1 NAD/NADP transhydrogenase alpha subunit [Paenibacillus crassostreae]OAB74567.1 NAD/NADP transhydrogenase alpha subunit [Paenibacillus crassostreae]